MDVTGREASSPVSPENILSGTVAGNLNNFG